MIHPNSTDIKYEEFKPSQEELIQKLTIIINQIAIEKVFVDDVLILVDPAATMFLIGSKMDYKESKFSSGFEFENPNEISRCGCGESFTVSSS